jgi:hypothetical protein
MKFIPVLFKSEMVNAILKNQKHMTRRTVNIKDIFEKPDLFLYVGNSEIKDVPRRAIKYDDRVYHEFGLKHNNGPSWVDTCPYGKPGDVLWVRENFYEVGDWAQAYPEDDEYSQWCGSSIYHYKADGPPVVKGKNDWNVPIGNTGTKGFIPYAGRRFWRSRPSLHMPKKACRLFLEITDIRVERLHDISEHDVTAEGAGQEVRQMWLFGANREERRIIYRDSFQTLWQSINGEDSWNINPWVWVISFRKTPQPPNFLN